MCWSGIGLSREQMLAGANRKRNGVGGGVSSGNDSGASLGTAAAMPYIRRGAGAPALDSKFGATNAAA